MTVVFQSHHFHDVFVDLIKDLQLVTLRRLLNIVATQEAKVLNTLLKNGNRLIPLEAVDLYSMQYLVRLHDEHAALASNVAMFVMYAQVFNEAYKRMQDSSNPEHCKTLKIYVIDLFTEMCSRFLDDRLCEDQSKICRSEPEGTCHKLRGFCTLRVLLLLADCELRLSSLDTTKLGEELFSCVHNYMSIVSTEALYEDPHSAGFTTPTKMLFSGNGDDRQTVLHHLLRPFEVKPKDSPQLLDVLNSGLCLNDDMQTLLKFVIHSILQIISDIESGEYSELYKILRAFIVSTYNIDLSEPCKKVFWGRVYSICFAQSEKESSEHLKDLRQLILGDQGDSQISQLIWQQ